MNLPDWVTLDQGRQIRAATQDDAARLIELYRELHKDDALPALADFVEELQHIQDSGNRKVYLIQIDSLVVGTLDLFLMRNLTRNLRPWAGIENLVVDSRYRGSGNGKALLDGAIMIARDLGAYKVQLISADKRDAAHRLYKSGGFNAPVSGYRMYLDPTTR